MAIHSLKYGIIGDKFSQGMIMGGSARSVMKKAGVTKAGIGSFGSLLEKSVKSVGTAAETAGRQVKAEAGRTSDNLTKIGTAALATAQDPGAWLAYAIDPTTGMVMGADKAKENYDTMSQAEKDKFKAEADQRMAKAQEEKAMKEQQAMTENRAKEAADRAKERAARLGKGRRGLLYQSTGEQGVTKKSTVLGG